MPSNQALTSARPACVSPSVTCRGSTLCISQSQLCDGQRDCPDGFDEEFCITKCPNRGKSPSTPSPDIPPALPACVSPSVMCRGSTLCISQSQLCDGQRDCPDGFDEEFCITKCPNRDPTNNPLCPPGEFRCKDRRRCIGRALVCDGRSHCHDGSDEVDSRQNGPLSY
uniref:Uncharacterized protein n=1 Tax=Esox lucius TaxID=8010 RepID=A0AAY5KBZ9_ESOLU